MTLVSGSIQSVERAAAVLRVLASQNEPMALTQLANSLDLAKGTAHGIIRTLVEVGFVDQDGETSLYDVGRGLLELGSARLDRNELRSRALNWSDALAAHTGEAVLVAVFEGGEAVIAHHVFRPDRSVQDLWTGSRLELHASALGKILLAYDPRAVRRLPADAMESLTYRTITDRSRLLRDLADVRDQGYAAAVEEAEPGIASIAAPIRDKDGYVIAAVGIQGRLEAVCDARSRPRAILTKHVMNAGRSISRELGHGRDL